MNNDKISDVAAATGTMYLGEGMPLEQAFEKACQAYDLSPDEKKEAHAVVAETLEEFSKYEKYFAPVTECLDEMMKTFVQTGDIAAITQIFVTYNEREKFPELIQHSIWKTVEVQAPIWNLLRGLRLA